MLRKLLLDQDGQAMTEYGLILAVLVVLLVTIPGLIADKIVEIYQGFLGIFEINQDL
jgi:Flp pilus assembly pilin Flp